MWTGAACRNCARNFPGHEFFSGEASKCPAVPASGIFRARGDPAGTMKFPYTVTRRSFEVAPGNFPTSRSANIVAGDLFVVTKIPSGTMNFSPETSSGLPETTFFLPAPMIFPSQDGAAVNKVSETHGATSSRSPPDPSLSNVSDNGMVLTKRHPIPHLVSDTSRRIAMSTGTVRLHRVLRAEPERVHRAFLEADAMSKWLPPHGFTLQGAPHRREDWRDLPHVVYEFRHRPRPFVRRRVSRTSRYSFGKIVHTDRFDDPNLPGEMLTTVTLKQVLWGTELTVVQEGLLRRHSRRDVLSRLAGLAHATGGAGRAEYLRADGRGRAEACAIRPAARQGRSFIERISRPFAFLVARSKRSSVDCPSNELQFEHCTTGTSLRI